MTGFCSPDLPWPSLLHRAVPLNLRGCPFDRKSPFQFFLPLCPALLELFFIRLRSLLPFSAPPMETELSPSLGRVIVRFFTGFGPGECLLGGPIVIVLICLFSLRAPFLALVCFFRILLLGLLAFLLLVSTVVTSTGPPLQAPAYALTVACPQLPPPRFSPFSSKSAIGPFVPVPNSPFTEKCPHHLLFFPSFCQTDAPG